MKILFITNNLKKTGGIEKYNQNLLKVLQELDLRTKIIELPSINLFAKLFFTFKVIFDSLIFKPSIIFCAHINFSPITLFLKTIFNQDYVIFTHGIDVWNLKSKLKKQALKKAKFIVSVSRFTADKLINQMPKLNGKIFILPNTVDGNKFNPKPKPNYLIDKYNLANKKVILTVGRLSETEGYKGYDKIIEAMPSVLEKVPNAVYLLVGSGGDVSRIKNLIRKFKLENQVILTGFVADNKLVDYYNLADVFVMPSKGEGFGIVFLEALACGKPVIAGNQDASREPLLNGKLGMLVNPDDVSEIAEVIIQVLTKNIKPQLYNGNFLRSEVLKAYGFDKFREKVGNLVSKIDFNEE